MRKGKPRAQLATRARILLKADVSEAGEGWSDSRIAEALDTSDGQRQRTRSGSSRKVFEAVLSRKYNPKIGSTAEVRRRGGSQADRAGVRTGAGGLRQMELRLLEEKVVELNIVEKASDNTIGRTLKKTFSNRISSSNG